MSIEQHYSQDFAESSFEDMDTSFSHLQPRRQRRRQLPSSYCQEQNIPTPQSLVSSDGSTFSRITYDKSQSLDNYTPDLDTNQEMTAEDEEFFSDFQEFRNNKDNFDLAIRNHFRLPLKPTYKEPTLENDFTKKLKIGPTAKVLRQPRSMFELKSQLKDRLLTPTNTTLGPSSNNRNTGKTAAMSYGNIKGPERGYSNLKVKKSMPSLSSYSPIVQNVDDHTFTLNDRQFDEVTDTNNFHTETTEIYNDSDFMDIEAEIIKPQFLNKEHISPLNLNESAHILEGTKPFSNSHRREEHNDTNRPTLMRADSKIRNNKEQRSKIETIKQQIDSNALMSKERSSYNPYTKKWDGGNKPLRKFQSMGTLNENSSPFESEIPRYTAKDIRYPSNNIRSITVNPKIVGKMAFDEKNLRWVSLNENEIDPFAELKDILPSIDKEKRDPYISSKSQGQLDRRHSNIQRFSRASSEPIRLNGNGRTHESTKRNDNNTKSADIFELNSKLLESFYHHENRWTKKVGRWFTMKNNRTEWDTLATFEDESVISNENNRNYLYEIRDMVINSSKTRP
ncbi:Bfa1p NDAI_0B01180 [Naumovozyma dairenensis CBS 421]|uniref:Uncharacterized protein n=1 Tax=Naumovozyma dairenensis (strain ATCC 10597 / BCRC 20456 / CBS 421 / NBRC 0211 / NRRL Y-12639) TaxID=1071378 RepID=G0W5U1_NAUDC|nr:hypothetical protein NDAI_0B01180 [Naumovozyma dairenensis CBS 421]CCD23152.1 hypothetical protein NDAI_0B01180 [Naumovozyma dairenensis CBS 421]